MTNTSDQDKMHEQIDKLHRLRRKVGDAIVEVLLEAHGGVENADRSKLIAVVDELLAWQPDDPPVRWPNDDVARVADEQFLGRDLPDGISKVAEGVRSHAGANPGDPTLDALLHLGQAVYPALLSSTDRCIAKDDPLYPLPARRLRTMSRADELLREEGLFPDRVKNESFQGGSTFGDYRPVRSHFEPSELIAHAAWELCLLRGAWTARDYGSAITEHLARIREANAAGETTAPVFLGLAGVKVEAPIQVEGITVRPYVGGIQSALLGRTERLEAYSESGFVAEVSQLWRYALTRGDAGTPASVGQIDWSELERLANAIAVGHAMGEAPELVKPHELRNPPQAPVPPILRWVCPADPIHNARSHHFSTEWPLGTAGRAMPFSEGSLRNALSLLQVDEESLQIAVRRIRDGLQPGRRWGDCLVDVVIAWEALSGDCRGDVAFRVCAFMAQLIASQGTRRDVRASLKKVYNQRSRVVHNGAVPRSSESRDSAVVAALVAVRQLCGPHATLLREDDRFSALCLDD